MKEKFKTYRKEIFFSSLVILLPIVFGLIMWNKLPEQMVTHWNTAGDADGFTAKFPAIFRIPLYLLLSHLVLILFVFWDRNNQKQHPKVFRLIFWIVPFCSLFAQAVVYSIALNHEFSIDIITPLMLSVIFIGFGNYFPKITQNETLGIRVTWTLENEENWNATHRFSSKVWVIGGLLMVFSIFLPKKLLYIVLVADLIALVAIPILYSYLYYKKQVAKGTYTKKAISSFQMNKGFSIVTVLFVGAICIWTFVMMFTGDIQYELKDELLCINASYYDDMTVYYENIEGIEYRQTDEKGRRTNGFGSSVLSMGTFKNEEFGTYTRYTYTKQQACIVLYREKRHLVIGCKTPEETRALYELLSERISD